MKPTRLGELSVWCCSSDVLGLAVWSLINTEEYHGDSNSLLLIFTTWHDFHLLHWRTKRCGEVFFFSSENRDKGASLCWLNEHHCKAQHIRGTTLDREHHLVSLTPLHALWSYELSFRRALPHWNKTFGRVRFQRQAVFFSAALWPATATSHWSERQHSHPRIPRSSWWTRTCRYWLCIPSLYDTMDMGCREPPLRLWFWRQPPLPDIKNDRDMISHGVCNQGWF